MLANMQSPWVRIVTSLFVGHAAGAGAARRQVFGVRIAPASVFGAARFGFEPAPFFIYARIRYVSERFDVDQ